MNIAPAAPSSPLPIRADLAEAIERTRERLSSAGTWWNARERLAIVDEIRHAVHCPLCRTRKAALSPYAVAGEHASLGTLPAPIVEAIHRLRTDANRVTDAWYEGLLAQGLSDTEYVELVGLVATVTALDTFTHAMGLPHIAFPSPRAGEPSRHRPRNARRRIARVPTVAPDEMTEDDVNPYPEYGTVHIQQAMSLVPASVIEFFDIDTALYLKQHWIRDFSREYRSLTHAQLELVAARASVLNGCYY